MLTRIGRILLAILIFSGLLSTDSPALAKNEYRETTLANEPKPLPGSLNERHPFEPIEMTPDDFVNVIAGETPGPALSSLFDLLGFTLRDDGIGIGLQQQSYITFSRSQEEIQRQILENVMIAGKPASIEIVYYGSPYYVNYAFFFMRSEEQTWRLIDCIYSYADAEIQHNSRMSWIVGYGEQSGTQEGIHFETWYNPHTRRIDVNVITSGNQIVESGNDRTDVFVRSRPMFYNYTYTDEAGDVVDDTAVSVVKYVALEQYKNRYVGNGEDLQLIQLDAYQQLDVYTFDTESCSLTLAGSWQFDNASPVLLEGYTYGLFLEGRVVIPQ